MYFTASSKYLSVFVSTVIIYSAEYNVNMQVFDKMCSIIIYNIYNASVEKFYYLKWSEAYG